MYSTRTYPYLYTKFPIPNLTDNSEIKSNLEPWVTLEQKGNSEPCNTKKNQELNKKEYGNSRNLEKNKKKSTTKNPGMERNRQLWN